MIAGLVAPAPRVPWAPPAPEEAELLRRCRGGGVEVQSSRWGRRWVPDHWVVEGLSHLPIPDDD